MNRSRYVRIIQGVLALVAVLLGLVTIITGARVLAGHDPGYVVFRPLLIYNVMMGIAYVAAGVIAWRNPGRGKHAAAAIFILNLLVLGGTGYLYAAGGAVAVESVRAMTLRTVVWLVLFLGLAWVDRKIIGHSSQREA